MRYRRSRAAAICGTIALETLSLSALAQAPARQETRGICSDNISNVAGNVSITQVCNLTVQQARLVVETNLREVAAKLESVIFQKNEFLFPAISGYIEHPTSGRWAAVLDEAREHNSLIRAVARSLIAYREGSQDTPTSITDLTRDLMRREAEIQELITSPAPRSTQDVRDWQDRYSYLYRETHTVLNDLQMQLRTGR